MTIIPSQYFLYSGVIGLSTFIFSPLNLTRNKIIKILQKFFIGLGAAFLIYWILNLPGPRTSNLLIAIITTWVLIFVLNLYHVYGFISTCKKCETPFNWGHCSGFEKIRNNMKKYSLDNFLVSLDEFSNHLKEKKGLKDKAQ